MPLNISNIANIRPLEGSLVLTYEIGGSVDVKKGDWVIIDANDKCQLAQANADATTYAVGMIVSLEGGRTTSSPGLSAGVCLWGRVSGFRDMDVKVPVWLSAAVAGGSTQTKPSGSSNRVYAPGRPVRSDILFINPPTLPQVAGV